MMPEERRKKQRYYQQQYRLRDLEKYRSKARQNRKKHYYKDIKVSREKARLYKREEAKNNIFRFIARNSRHHHRSEGHEVTITLDEAEALLRAHPTCQLCGVSLDFSPERKKCSPNLPSIDRIDNGDTMTKDNVMVLCFSCNQTKSNRTLLQFINYCKMITEKFNQFDKYTHENLSEMGRRL
jgi:5-methylcytosine-specific restriction endonuclease McrA